MSRIGLGWKRTKEIGSGGGGATILGGKTKAVQYVISCGINMKSKWILYKKKEWS
jgi:hypothetical protein